MSKKVNVFGKAIPMFAIVILGMALVSAALLPYFAQLTGLVTVNQGLSVDGESWDTPLVFDFDETELSSLEEQTLVSSHSLSNDASIDAEVKFVNECSESEGDGCDDVTTTDVVELSVVGFETGDDSFDTPYYRKTDYESSVTNLDDIEDITYGFEITENEFGVTNLAPYVVLVGTGIGSYDVAVQMIPDGGTYNIDEEYTKTVDDTTLFHVPGDSECTQSSPCTLARVKEKWPSATMTKVRLALGAWPGSHIQTISVLMGISKINDLQAVHKSLIIEAGETLPFSVITYFPEMMKPATYTITTTVEPVVSP